MQEFRLQTIVRVGTGALESLEAFSRQRVLVVTDPFLRGQPIFGEILARVGDPVEVFSEVQADPGLAVVRAGVAAYVRFEPDVVVAFGGGSVMDTAKAVHKAAVDAGIGAKEGIIAIPSTSGSGSEVTSFAVITHEASQTKVPIISEEMVARIAILDPQVVRDLPTHITADSGMDVLTHAVEAYVATDACDFTDALAEKATALVLEHLERCFRHGEDLEARAHMHNASCMAAMAFENAGLGITHSLAHAIGGHFHIAHGRLNAMLLPHVIEFNASRSPAAARRYARLAREVSPDARGQAAVVCLVTRIRRLNEALGIPSRLDALGVDRGRYRRAVQEMAASAMVDGCTATNPVQPHQDDLVALLRLLA